MDYKEKVIALLNSQELSKEQKEGLEKIFPELKESEDERIRKDIMHHIEFEYNHNIIPHQRAELWIAWLEKKSNLMKALQFANKTIGELTDENYHLREKLNEQKPYGQREECVDCQCNYAGECKGSCAMKRGEQKPSWSEEDASLCTRIQGILSVCKSHSLLSPDLYKDMCDWLKSLRPQNRWKPSGFHLESISDAIAMYEERGINAIGLKEILEQLKELKGKDLRKL